MPLKEAITEKLANITLADLALKVLGFSSYLAEKLSGVIPLSQAQVSILITIIGLVILYLVLKAGEKIKPIAKVFIIILIIWLIIGFFVG